MSGYIKSLHRFPLKSGRGESLEKLQLDRFGIIGDRQYLLVDHKGLFISQRLCPDLSRLKVEKRSEKITLKIDDKQIEISEKTDNYRVVRIWNETLQACDLGEITSLIQPYIKNGSGPIYLVRANPKFPRFASKRWTQNRDVPYFFADRFPILVASDSSLNSLNRLINEQNNEASSIPMSRFRPNVVIDGWKPFLEDQVSKIKINNTIILLAKPCGRCSITKIDQSNGTIPSDEPIKTLAKYRMFNNDMVFGWLAYSPQENEGLVIRRNDKVEILELLQKSRVQCTLSI